MMRLFYAYATADARHRDRLEGHLRTLQQKGVLSGWQSRVVSANAGTGNDRAAVSPHVAQSDVVLLLVSADLVTSNYLFGPEVGLAMERHRKGETRVIPVLLRPCSWKQTPIGPLPSLPPDGKPVTRWSDADGAFRAIAAGIEAVAGAGAAARSRASAPAESATTNGAAPSETPGTAGAPAAGTPSAPTAAAVAPAGSPLDLAPSEVALRPHELGPGYTALDAPGGAGGEGASSSKFVSVAGLGTGAAARSVAQLVYRARSAGDAADRLEAGVRAEVSRGGRSEPLPDAWEPGAAVRRVRLVGRSTPGAIVLAAKDRFLVAAKVSGGEDGAPAGDGLAGRPSGTAVAPPDGVAGADSADPASLAESVVRRMLARIPVAP